MTRDIWEEDELSEFYQLEKEGKFDEIAKRVAQAVLVEQLAEVVAAKAVATLPRVIRDGLPRPTDDGVPVTTAECLAQIREELTGEAPAMVIAQGNVEGLRRGFRKIRARTQLYSVLTVLRARNIDMAWPIRDRLVAEKDPERLTRWLKAACIATSIEDIDWDLLTVPAEPG